LDYKRVWSFSTPKQKEKRITDTLLFLSDQTFYRQSARMLAERTGLEPATPGVTGRAHIISLMVLN